MIRFIFAALTCLVLLGCARKAPDIDLQARTIPYGDPRTREIHVELAAQQGALRYKWFADEGQCDPQDTTSPVTVFRFANGSKADHVTVEVWQEGARIARARLLVENSPHPATRAGEDIHIEITEIPPSAVGGPETRTHIGGTVTGSDVLPQYRVIIYARDDGVWWIQPSNHASLAIATDHTWGSWSHLGQSYAAFVVRPNFPAVRTLDALPGLGGDILARTEVDGRKPHTPGGGGG